MFAGSGMRQLERIARHYLGGRVRREKDVSDDLKRLSAAPVNSGLATPLMSGLNWRDPSFYILLIWVTVVLGFVVAGLVAYLPRQ